MTMVSIHMPEQSGQSGLTLFLRKTSDGTLLNAGGDALSESPASSGRFIATVAETWAETLAASVRNASSLTVRDGWLAVGETIVRDAFPSSGGGGAGDASQATLLEVEDKVDAIAAAFAGASAVEATGRVAKGGKVTAYIGDDFRARSGTALPIPVSDPAGGLFTKLTALTPARLRFGVTAPGRSAGLITGTIFSITQSGSGASQLCTLNVEITNCGAGLPPGDQYLYQIEQEQTHSAETDDFVEIEGKLILKQRAV